MERHAARQLWSTLANSLNAPGLEKYYFSDGDRWSSTATDGGGLGQGDPMTLTWSIVPDGTSIFGYNGEGTSNSNLRAFLDGIYGSQANWLPIFEQVFERWSELTGATYVYEPNDDGSAWTSLTILSGQLGVRGDVRIAGHTIDGNSNVLAYNFFPNFGDMVIDTADNFYSNTSGNSLGFRNVLAHEHGHGLGISHVCPVNQTKLMEPFVSSAFDGPQHDDVLAANRGYGDADEQNDSSGAASDLGALSELTLEDRSIDDNSDIDFYSFTVGSGDEIDVTVTPVGSTYLSGPQNPPPSSSCTAGTDFNSLNLHDLSIRVLDTDGSTELASANLADAGLGEVLTGVALTSGAGTYFVEISGDASNSAQLYRLELLSVSFVFADGFESGDLSRWN